MKPRGLTLLFAGLLAVFAAATAAIAAPLVIAHRGASGYLPEHTLEAYAFAYALGADYIEPDLVMTRDRVLIARHEPQLDESTDVAERFPDRRAADGHFYAADFTWAEIEQLHAKERLPHRFPQGSAVFGVPRLEQIMALVAGLNASTGCDVGLYPELKSPGWHRQQGLLPAVTLQRVLGEQPFGGPLLIQSFEDEPLRALVERFGYDPAQLVQLMDPQTDPDMFEVPRLLDVATYASTIGPPARVLAEGYARGSDLVQRAHAAGLKVHTWTLRADDVRAFDSFEEAVRFAANLGVDGLFTDHPDQALAALGRNKETVACKPIPNRAP